jgi:hypothetical protein
MSYTHFQLGELKPASWLVIFLRQMRISILPPSLCLVLHRGCRSLQTYNTSLQLGQDVFRVFQAGLVPGYDLVAGTSISTRLR